MRRAKLFLKNTLLLTASALLMRLLSMGFQAWLGKKVGAAGIGLYELLMSAYGLAAALAISGVRLSTIRLLMENEASRRSSRSGVVKLCLTYALLLGSGAGVLLWCCADPVAALWLDRPELTECLRILSASLPCLALSSCLDGCFSALRQAGRITGIQMASFAIHALLTAAALLRFSGDDPVRACTLLVWCGCLSDLGSLLFSWLAFRRERWRQSCPLPLSMTPRLLQIALPDAVGSWIRSGLVTAKHLLIPKGLRRTGASANAALATYGVIQGMALPVLGFPAVFLGTVAGLLVPEVAENHAKGQTARLHAILQRTLHLTLLLSFFAAGALYCYGGKLGLLLYRSGDAADYIRLLAPLTPLMYLDNTVDAMLKGMGLQTVSMRINMLDAAVSLLLVWQLIPRVGVAGYLFTIYVSETLNFLLSYRRLNQTAGLRLALYRSVLAPLLASCGAMLLPRLLFPALPDGMLLLLSVPFYGLLLRLLGSVSKSDLRWFRGIFQS